MSGPARPPFEQLRPTRPARFPALELDRAVEEPAFDPNMPTGGLTALPVTW
ncbi:hypothetical protein ACFOWE_12070 [Planomonospora corallina]|uniref:Uncharacterized protein n=1 Tax=Planomonospora corallina TaxID=1806052 RepID=A0ABV8I9B2_9ACTN